MELLSLTGLHATLSAKCAYRSNRLLVSTTALRTLLRRASQAPLRSMLPSLLRRLQTRL